MDCQNVAFRLRLPLALWLFGVALFLAVAGGPSAAWADVTGTAPAPYRDFRVFGQSRSIGNTLMRNLPSEPLVNAVLLSESQARLSNVPNGSSIAGAFLFWSGSVDDDVGVDNTATLRLPNGVTRPVRAERCFTATNNFGGGLTADFFYCRADVTAEVAGFAGGGAANGLYTVGGITAMPGLLAPGGGCLEPTCQAMYAGWSLVVVYENDSESTLRDVSIYDGFQLYDETPTAAGVSSFVISGFDIADPPEATIRLFGLEGDALLGVPPQDSDPVLRCNTCFDYMSVNGTKLSDPLNPANNLFNSTLPEGSAIGIDIDSFDISSVVRAGDSQIRIEVGSGDGNPATGQQNGAGGGELFGLGYTVVTVNRLAPNFRGDNTFLTADPLEVSPGETIFYTLQVTNEGSLDGTNVIARLPLPAGTEYVPGSTRVDGVAVPDSGTNPPWLSGLNLGTIPNDGDNDRRITFRLRVLPTTPGGTLIRLAADITARELTETTTTNETVVRVVAPTLLTPRKTFLDINGGLVEPGDLVTYTIAIRKDLETSAAGITFIDDLPAFVRLVSVNAGGFTDQSNPNGGSNGTGQVRVTNIQAARGLAQVTLSFTVRVLSVAELIDQGVDPAAIDGLIVSNQGRVQAGFLAADLLTDDPTTTPSPDATRFAISSSINFANAETFKRITDDNGGSLEPGDSVTYTISLRNTGNSPATIDLTDDFPRGFSGAALVTPVAGVTVRPAPAGANGAGRLEAFGLSVGPRTTVVIRVRGTVAADASAGTSLQNTARLVVNEAPDQSRDLVTEDLQVVAGPVFVVNKTASGSTGGFQPGDTVTWTVSVRNIGNQPATNVRITDVVAPELTSIVPGTGGTYTAATRTVLWTLPSLAVGAEQSVTFTSVITATVPSGTIIANQANVIANGVTVPTPSDDPTTPDALDPTVVRVDALPAIVFTKTVTVPGGGPAEPGDVLTWTLTLRNDGRASATDIIVVDPIDASLVDITPSAGGVFARNAIQWTSATTPALASLAPGRSVTLTFTSRIADGTPDGAVISNQAASSSNSIDVLSDDPAVAGVADPTTVTVSAEADLTDFTKQAFDLNGGAPQPGDLIAYALTVTNNGSGSAFDVIIRDTVPAGLEDITVEGGSYDPASRTAFWTLPNVLGPGEAATVRLNATIVPGTANGTRIENQARVESAGTSPVLSDNPDTPAVDDPTVLVVESRPDFAQSTKTVTNASGTDTFAPGDEVVYTIEVVNTGTEDATNITVTDAIDPSLNRAAAEQGGTVAGGVATWTIPALAVGEAVELTLTAELAFPLADGTLVSNQASVSAPGVPAALTDDPTTAADDDPTEFVVASRPELVFTKSFSDINGGSIEPGDTIAWVLSIENIGSEAARSLVITDEIDPSFAAVTFQGVDIPPGVLQVSEALLPELGSLEPGDLVTLEFEATLQPALANGTRVSNQASVEATNLEGAVLSDDPSTAVISDPTSFQVISSFDFSASTKSLAADPDGFRPGEEVSYTITVTNTGNEVATSVVVTEPLPAELTFVSASPNGRRQGGNVVWDSANVPALASVAPGDSVSFTVRARIAEGLRNGTVISNQATVNAAGGADAFLTDDPSTPEIGDATDLTVLAEPGLGASTKTVVDDDGDGFFEPGDTVTYVIRVVAGGDGPALNVVVQDTIDVANLDTIQPLGGGVFADGQIRWDANTTPALSEVIPGADNAVELRVRARVRAGVANGVSVSNQASVGAFEVEPVLTDDPETADLDDPTTFVVSNEARIGVRTKVAVDVNGGSLQAGDVIEYTITVSNDGTVELDPFVITDEPSPFFESFESDGAVVSPTGGLAWEVSGLGAGEVFEARVVATLAGDVPDGTLVANQANIQLPDGQVLVTDDPSTDAPDDPTIVVVGAQPDFSSSTLVASVDSAPLVAPGNTINYTARIINTGAASGPAQVAFVFVPALVSELDPGSGILVAPSTIVFELDGVDADEIIELTFSVRIADGLPNGTIIPAQGTITADDIEVTVTDNPATAEIDDTTDVVLNYPELLNAAKTARDLNGGDLEPGDLVEYIIDFGAGEGPALTNIFVSDQLDERLELVTADGARAEGDPALLVWSPETLPLLAELAPGQSVNLRYVARVRDNAQIGDAIANQATLRSSELLDGAVTDDPATPEPDDPTVLFVGGSFDGGFSGAEKSVIDLNEGFVEPGDVLQWTISASWVSSVASVNAVLRDALSPLVSLVDGSVLLNGEPLAVAAGDLANGLPLGVIEAGGAVSLTFQTVVNSDAPAGARIDNQGFFAADGAQVTPTDDVATAAVNDPTSVIVGEAADVSRTIKTATLLADNGDGVPSAGDTFLYRIEIPNTGTAVAAGGVFSDVLDDNAQFQPGTLVLNGSALTEAPDNDAGELVGQALSVRVGDILPGESVVIEFVVRAVGGTSLRNQGSYTYDGGSELTDDDGNPANGDSATIIPLGGEALPLLASKTVADPDGGVIEAGDELLYTLEFRALTATVELIEVFDEADTGIVLEEIVAVDPDVQVTITGPESLVVTLPTMNAGESRTVIVRATLNEDLEDGTTLCNTLVGDFADEVAPACVTIGGTVGLASWTGTVFRERGDSGNKDFDPGVDQPLPGFVVRVLRADAVAAPVAEATADADGVFSLPPLVPGDYEIRVFAPGGPEFGGALFLEVSETAGSGERRDLQLEVVPAGIIYNADSYGPVGGVRANLLYGPGDSAAGQLVPAELLADPSQQGQLVPANGFYRFDAPAGRSYEVSVDTAGLALRFPSSLLPPAIDAVQLDGEGVQTGALLDPVDGPVEDLRYSLTFTQVDEGAELKNNHIPLDPFTASIVLTKRADRVAAYVGDIVTYTITMSNQSGADVLYNPATGRGGAFLADAIPNTFRYVDGSAAAWLRTEQGEEQRIPMTAQGTILLEFGQRGADDSILPFSIPAGSEMEVRYQLVIGSSTDPGTRALNRAQLRSADGGVLLSNADTVAVRIDYDPIFDQGTIIGKVYCDDNGDGRQNRGEMPLASGRIYLDVGYYTDVDAAGQYHFVDIDPGLHLIKLDTATLPAGSELTTDERRLINITRGMPAMVDFGVTCVENLVDDVEVLPGDDALVAAAQLRQRRYVEIDGSLANGELTVDGSDIEFIHAALTAASGQGAVPAPPVLPVAAAPAVDADATEGSGADAAPSIVRAGGASPPARLAVRLDPDGYLVDPIQLALASSEGVTRWVVEARTVDGDLIAWQLAGDGQPPSSLSWDGTVDGSGSVLAPSTVYRLQLRVFSGEALYASSAPVLLEVAGTRVRRLVDERFSGELRDGRRPTADLQAWIASTARAIGRQPAQLPVRVEAHVDDSGDSAADVATTESEAELVRELLVEAGVAAERIEAIGRGSSRPLYPNIGQRTRQTNRRIDLRIDDPELEVLPVTQPSTPLPAPGLYANERQLEVSPDGSFAMGVPRTDDGLVAFQMRLEDRSEIAALVAVRSLEQLPRFAESLLPAVPVEVDLNQGMVSIGGATWPLDGLAMTLTADSDTHEIERNRLNRPFDLEASGVPADVDAWRLEVFGPFGTRIWDQGGSGSVDGRLRWNGDANDGERIAGGCYDARLTVRTVDGGLITTAPVPLCVQQEGLVVETPAPVPTEDRVLAFGSPMSGADGRYSGEVRRVTGQRIVLDVSRQGVRQLVSFPVPQGYDAQLTTNVEVLPQNLSIALDQLAPVQDDTEAADDDAPRGRRRGRGERPAQPVLEDDVEPEASEPESEPEPAPEPEPGPVPAPTTDDDLFRPVSAFSPEVMTPGQPLLAMRPMAAPSFMQLDITQASERPGSGASTGELPSYQELEDWYAREVDLALSTDEGEELARLLAESEAGQLSVQLPPAGFRLQSSSLAIYGTTHPDNEVFINGQAVYTYEGEFAHVVDLPSGSSEIVIETLDKQGNRGRIVWPVEVAAFRYFVMALGDSAIGTRDSDIAGSHDHNSTTVANGNVMLYGQARAYFKGWLSGDEVLNGYFDEIEMTAHVDTGRRNEYEPFLREVIQPDRYYPVFGDSSEQVNDVNSRGKVYVLLEADESSITLGNYRTGIQGVELMRYDRNLYGGQVVFDDVIAENYRTEIRGFAAEEDYQGARTFNYLQGTGGSIYYLQNRPVIEGSEQVFLIVRDRISGAELARIPQSRNTDYTVRYSEGRLVMRRPIPSVVDDSTMLGGYSTSRSLLAGNPVFIEVAYDYESVGRTEQGSYGVFGRETFFNVFSVGGGIVQEERAGARDYRLWSVETGVGATATTRVDAEYARSVSDDLRYGYSQDGGLTYQQFRADNPRNDSGDALYVRGQFELADVIETDRSRILYFDTYYNRQDRGFFSNGNVLDQGEEKFGGLGRWFVNENHAFSIRHDSTISTLDNLLTEAREDTLTLTRRVNTAQYEFAYDPVTVTVSYQNTFTEDYRRAQAFQNDIVGAAIYYQIARRVRFGFEQEIVARGEDSRIIRGADSNESMRVEDRFISGVSVAADIGAGIELQATERFRYSGENSTMIGMRAEIDEESDIYVQQRLTSFRDNHGTASTTVVGGEQRYGQERMPGRSYGEYHMDTGVSGERSRAVLGFGQAWRPTRGLSFSAGYERSQTLAAEGGDTDSSRDTVSVSSEFLRLRDFKASSLLEVRFDRGSLISPSTGSCLANDVSGNPLYCRDRITAVGDRMQFVTMTSAEWKVDRDYTFFGRFDYVVTDNQTLDQLESRDMEGTFGIAYRPLFINWLNVLGRYTYLEALAPYELDTSLSRQDQSHVLSVSPILELPWNLQLVEKVAYRNIRLRTEGLPMAENDLVLWINRINYHLTRQFDIGAEYRFLHQSLTQDWLHGVLLEFNWIVEDHVRLGVGYNFTRFAEDELGDFNRDSSGVFFRVTAQY